VIDVHLSLFICVVIFLLCSFTCIYYIQGEESTPEVVDEDLKDTVLSSFQTDGKNVEVVFSFDTTGSMSSYLSQVSHHFTNTDNTHIT
jgi:hypothetical protein